MIYKKIIQRGKLCGFGACPAVYEATKEIDSKDYEQNVYLVVGKTVNPKGTGLESNIGNDETLIEIPKELIDKLKK